MKRRREDAGGGVRERARGHLRIGLKFTAPTAHSREVLRGALIALEEARLEDRRLEAVIFRRVEEVERKRFAGVIGYFEQNEAAALAASATPAISVSARFRGTPLPLVTSDNAAIGQLAAEHLKGLGYARFAYCGPDSMGFAVERGAAFRERLAALGLRESVARFADPPQVFWEDPDRLCGFLESLPTPVALFCATDHIAVVVSRYLQLVGRAVPAEVALLGVDDDDLAILAGGQRLSTVKPDFPRIGATVVDFMLRWLREGRAPPPRRQVPPLGLLGRASTDFCVDVDPRLARAMAFIRGHACEPIRIEDVLRGIPLSRRYFETRFRDTFGCSPYEEILRLRIEHAKTLLRTEPGLTVAQIADHCGYDNAKQFSVTFRKHTQLTPGAYRNAESLAR